MRQVHKLMRDIRHVFSHSLWHMGRSRAGVPVNGENIFVHGETSLFMLQKGPRTCFIMEGAWDFIHLSGTTGYSIGIVTTLCK